MMELDTFTGELKKGWKTIAFFTGGFFGFSLIYCLFLFKPTYLSESKVLIEEVTPTTFVTDLGKERKLETNSAEKNPILTQIEILSSQDMARRVYDALLRQNDLQRDANPKKEAALTQKIQRALKLKTPPATDIIEVDVSWDDPEMAYKLNQTFLNEYRAYNIDVNKTSVSQAKKYIKDQLERTQKELQQIRDRIRHFKKASSSVDLNVEASSIVKEVADTQNAISNLNSQISYHQGKVSEYSSKLHVAPGNVKKALNSVALGQNESLNTLQKELRDAEQQYASWKLRYPDTTKKMSSLKEHISTIKEQIHDQVAATVGQNVEPGVVIKDSVRTQIVNHLVDSQAEALSLRAQRQSLQKQLGYLQSKQHKIPDMQVTLSELVDREISLTSIANALSSKLVEASVRESEIISNINVVQVPTLPANASFPTIFHVMLIMSILGASAGCLAVLARYYLLDTASDASEIENLLHMPIYGHLSWVSDSIYSRSAVSQPASEVHSLEYQRIVTALRVKHEDHGVNVIGFTSTAKDTSRSNITCAIARLLSKCNYSVLLIDADFRHGTVAQEFGLNSNQLPDFKELLTNEQFWQQGQMIVGASTQAVTDINNSYVEQYITRLDNEKSLYLMTKGEDCSMPYELVTSKFFPQMIAQVKNKFDFVLVDMPPAVETSDTLIISRFLDGLVTICGLNSSRAKLKAVRKLFDDNSVKTLGAIIKSNN